MCARKPHLNILSLLSLPLFFHKVEEREEESSPRAGPIVNWVEGEVKY